MPSPAPLVVFDLDGTLAETAGDLMGALNHVLALDGIAPLPVDRARNLLGSGGRALIRRGYATDCRDLDEARLEVLFGQFLAFYEDHIADHSHLFPGVMEALDRIEARGYGMAVCTNKLERTARKLLDVLGVSARFEAICGQDTFAVSKPKAGALLGTIAAAGGRPDRSVMVGDSVTDIATAKAANVPVVAVDFGYTDTPVADLGPDRVIGHFDELDAAVEALLVADRANGGRDRD